jgi:ATP-dependent protease ClpP protease subunit
MIPFTDIPGRTVGLFGRLDQEKCLAAADTCMRIRSSGSRQAIHFYLGCHGGEQDDVFTLLDCLLLLGRRLSTYLLGTTDEHGLLILATGTRRYALPSSRLRPLGGPRNAHTIGFNGIHGSNSPGHARMHQFLIQQLGHARADAILACDSELNAEHALQLGLIQKIVHPHSAACEQKLKRLVR